MPDPGDEDAALVKELHRQRHKYLGDEVRGCEDGGEHKVYDHPIHTECRQFLVIKDAYLYQDKYHDRQLKRDAHP